MNRVRVVPIDIDFAGWTEVQAGDHNAWGVIETRDDIDWLISWHSMKFLADKAAEAEQK